MNRNRSILALIAVLAVVAGGYLAYDNVLRGDSVAPLALPGAAPSVVAASTPSAPISTDAAGTEPSTTTVDGTSPARGPLPLGAKPGTESASDSPASTPSRTQSGARVT